MALQINRMISAYNHNTGNISRIKYIVIHYVGALGGAKANCEYYGGGNRSASAHYFVDFDGTIWQCVEDKDIAWHCGAKSYRHAECRNANSIGVELCVRKKNTASLGAEDKDWYFEDATVAAAAELVRDLMDKYNVPADHVIRHYDVTGKICPNPYVYNTGTHTWDEFKGLISGKAVSTAEYLPGMYKVNVDELTIRTGPGVGYVPCDVIQDEGTYTITEIRNTSWGKLLSGAGWINVSAKYCTYVGTACAVVVRANNPYPVPTQTIKYVKGNTMKGDDVKWVQWELREAGYDIEIDGSFGPASDKALRAYQAQHGLVVDGKCGPATRACMQAD